MEPATKKTFGSGIFQQKERGRFFQVLDDFFNSQSVDRRFSGPFVVADDFCGKIYKPRGNSAFVPHGIHAHDASIGSIATVYLPTRKVESYGRCGR